MLISSSVAMAGLPSGLGFDQYTSAAGAITPTTGSATNNYCPTGFACDAPISGDGFYQRQLTDTVHGTKYFQTIVLDKNTTITGAADFTDPNAAKFVDESFIQQGTGTGIANQSRVNAKGTGADQTTLKTLSSVFTGTAFSTNSAAANGDLTVSQNLDDAATLTHVGFNLDRAAGAAAPNIALDSTVYLVDNGVTPTTSSPKQLFVLRQKYVTGTPTDTALVDGSSQDLISKYPTVATISPDTYTAPMTYHDGDTIQLMWVAQQVVTDPTSTPVGSQSFGAETLSVNPDPATAGTSTPVSESYSNQTVLGTPNGSNYNPYLWIDTFAISPAGTGGSANPPVF